MEVNMCKTLEFGFGKPLPLHFLRRFSKAAQVKWIKTNCRVKIRLMQCQYRFKADPKQHTLAKYLMELSLHDAEFSSMDPSLLAAASLHLSLQLLNGPKWVKSLNNWPKLHHITTNSITIYNLEQDYGVLQRIQVIRLARGYGQVG